MTHIQAINRCYPVFRSASIHLDLIILIVNVLLVYAFQQDNRISEISRLSLQGSGSGHKIPRESSMRSQ